VLAQLVFSPFNPFQEGVGSSEVQGLDKLALGDDSFHFLFGPERRRSEHQSFGLIPPPSKAEGYLRELEAVLPGLTGVRQKRSAPEAVVHKEAYDIF